MLGSIFDASSDRWHGGTEFDPFIHRGTAFLFSAGLGRLNLDLVSNIPAQTSFPQVLFGVVQDVLGRAPDLLPDPNGSAHLSTD